MCLYVVYPIQLLHKTATFKVMKRIWLALLFCVPSICSAQYLFQGEVSEDFYGKQVHLSLVEDYRKLSRVYLDQIIAKTQADSLGNFSFEGNQLPIKNRIYRIHVDGCDQSSSSQNHFLGACSLTQSLLFIANNRDTLSVPLDTYNQAFCEIASTNSKSGLLLDVETLKEEMILDLIESESETAQSLHMERWFEKFQEYGRTSDEPLVDLYAFSFLSDRSSETHHHYLKNLTKARYYTNLLLGLVEKYPDAAFTSQYVNELEADRTLAEETFPKPFVFKWKDWLPILSIIGVLIFAIGYYWFLKKRNPRSKILDQLSPREKLIYNAIKNGKTNKEISATLFISHSTVKTHINNIYRKLGVTSREELP